MLCIYIHTKKRLKFDSIVQILKQVQSNIVVRDNFLGRFCQHGVILFQQRVSVDLNRK